MTHDLRHTISDRQYSPWPLLLLLASSPSAAQWQDLAAVRASAEQYVREQTLSPSGRVSVAAALPDPRLRLPACEDLRPFTPPGVRWWGPATVGIRCESPSVWTFYLPVTVRVNAEVVVAARAIHKGQTITASDLSLQTSDITQQPLGVLTDPQLVIGRSAKTHLGGGMAVRQEQLRAEPLVHQGEQVQLAFAGDGFEVSGRGRAVTSAGLGEAVSVRADSGRVLKGVVRAKGSVWVR